MKLPERYRRACDAVPAPDRTGRVTCVSQNGFHEIAYTDWGDEKAESNILCVHGLTRNGRDFDVMASRLSDTARVVCPDLAGRGLSDWLRKAVDYHMLQYNMDMTVLAARVGFERFDWIGTSLGGLMGMSLAAMKGSPIRRLILNDVAPSIPHSALRRIFRYMGSHTHFETLQEAEAHLRTTLSPFGPMTDDDWARLTVHSTVLEPEGIAPGHDPSIMENFRRYALFMHFSLWHQWERITCPVLILRGSNSDFLTKSLLDRMLSTHPDAEAIEFEDVGHTPTLNASWQIDPIVDWLAHTDART